MFLMVASLSGCRCGPEPAAAPPPATTPDGATLQLAAWVPGRVSFRGPSGEVTLSTAPAAVPAGDGRLVVESRWGTLAVPLAVAPGERKAVDATPLQPSAFRLGGLPLGTELRVEQTLLGEQRTRVVKIPSTGVVNQLAPGPTRLEVQGERLAFDLIPGELLELGTLSEARAAQVPRE
jgi:hypothetical protein